MTTVTASVAALPVSLNAGVADTPALFVADKASCTTAVHALISKIKTNGPSAIESINLIDRILAALNDRSNPCNREAAAFFVQLLASKGTVAQLEPFVLSDTSEGLIPTLLDAFADKVLSVRTSAVEAVLTIIKNMNPWATPLLIPALLHHIKTARKWQIKVGSLTALNELVKVSPIQTASLTPEIVPILAEAIWDTKSDVKKAARESLKQTATLISNKDIGNFITAIIHALINPVEEVPKTIHLLSVTTFVSEVDASTLSFMVPSLSRGLQERPTATKRRCAAIVDNMLKHVNNQHIVLPFIPKLLPSLLRVEETMADPETRSIVTRAIATLRDVAKLPEGDGSNPSSPKVVEVTYIAKLLASAYKKAGAPAVPTLTTIEAVYATKLATNMAQAHMFDSTEWLKTLPTYVSFIAAQPDSGAVVRELLLKAARNEGEETEVHEDEEAGEDLCNCICDLTSGASILLNAATLRLKRGHRYGLCGRDGSGKSMLMRAITNGQLEGFPSPDKVRTFYVKHDVDGSEESTTILNFILSDKRILVDKKEVTVALASVGFNDEHQGHSIDSLSGGWKMRLNLARAILFKADILLFDELANRLDLVSILWLEKYLTSLTHCISIIVSHDFGFLNNTITDVLHLNRFKIRRYRGNLEAFIKAVPEAKSYYNLEGTEDYKFTFPNPSLLEGVKTKVKSLLKMHKVGFQYPSQSVQQLYDITLQVSLSSRVAILGPKGSGKSTLFKLLIGDIEANKGAHVWKHPNLIIGYVAQHAFHHIEQRLDKTPLEYMLYRYQAGEDREEIKKVNRELAPEEVKKMKEGAYIVIEGQKCMIDEINNRKKVKQSYEYEVSFKDLSFTETIWLPRDELIKRGFEKRVLEIDTREAQRRGLLRPLVRREIEKHFADFDLEPEIVSYKTIRGLSASQKVKVVLGAATWRRPHVLALDEPTNYLDRKSLAALIGALKSFGGGVIITTHSRDFSDPICSEVWTMREGRLEASGHNWAKG